MWVRPQRRWTAATSPRRTKLVIVPAAPTGGSAKVVASPWAEIVASWRSIKVLLVPALTWRAVLSVLAWRGASELVIAGSTSLRTWTATTTSSSRGTVVAHRRSVEAAVI